MPGLIWVSMICFTASPTGPVGGGGMGGVAWGAVMLKPPLTKSTTASRKKSTLAWSTCRVKPSNSTTGSRGSPVPPRTPKSYAGFIVPPLRTAMWRWLPSSAWPSR